ncbi:MAG TPA: pseudouridine synthase [Polyangiaceae bacterium]|jgi:23S rRNA pseudouridine1911/1915/1917 synthase|nr:pseudouridine synthase [Polyangiaceae bacterium]
MSEERYVVPPELDGHRLDKAAAKLADGLSVARLKRAIEDGHVRVDGRWRAKGATVAAGETISIAREEVAQPDAPAAPEPDAPLVVRFQGKGVIVVDKPAGQPTTPLKAGERGTLVNALVGHFPELAGVGYGPREPGVLHRIDTSTSGLIIVARNKPAFDVLRAGLLAGEIRKKYLLVCASDGLADEGTIAHPIANHPKDTRRVLACVHPRDVMRYRPRQANTNYKVLQRSSSHALVEVDVEFALRHQIRVHFASIGHPLVGDELYGSTEKMDPPRHALHASFVGFDGDGDVSGFAVESALPPEIFALIQ